MAPVQNDPARPERGPGRGRDMPAKLWQDDAWLPDPADAEFRDVVQNTIDELLERRTSVVDTSCGKPMNVVDVDPLCVAAARLLEKLMERVYGTHGG